VVALTAAAPAALRADLAAEAGGADDPHLLQLTA
jgi:hypothetical protein